MKTRIALVAASFSLLAGYSAAHADILNAQGWTAQGFTSDWVVPNILNGVSLLTNADANVADAWGVSGSLDTPSDPSVENIVKVTNNSGSDWTSFAIAVTADPSSAISNLTGIFPPDGDTTFFTTNSAAIPFGANGQTITFFGGAVPNGQTVKLDFSFDLTTVNTDFNYTVASSPAPEPASLALLAAGSPLLLKRRRA